jgi:hypothetical protein
MTVLAECISGGAQSLYPVQARHAMSVAAGSGEGIMHPTFVKLFIETDADDLLDEEEARRRRARQSRRNRPAVVVRAASAVPGR